VHGVIWFLAFEGDKAINIYNRMKSIYGGLFVSEWIQKFKYVSRNWMVLHGQAIITFDSTVEAEYLVHENC
jgi:hypothetical protein